jgi:hypothetical protein
MFNQPAAEPATRVREAAADVERFLQAEADSVAAAEGAEAVAVVAEAAAAVAAGDPTFG